jgi:hypothetical protein
MTTKKFSNTTLLIKSSHTGKLIVLVAKGREYTAVVLRNINSEMQYSKERQGSGYHKSNGTGTLSAVCEKKLIAK